MKDLVQKLPQPSMQQIPYVSNDTIASVLAVLYRVLMRKARFVQTFRELGGTRSLAWIMQQGSAHYNDSIIDYASRVISNKKRRLYARVQELMREQQYHTSKENTC